MVNVIQIVLNFAIEYKNYMSTILVAIKINTIWLDESVII